MKRFFILAFLLLSVAARGAVIFPINDTSGFIGQFPTNYNQSISNLNAAIAAGGVAQSPFTNDLDAAGNSIENLDAPEITNTTIFIRLWGTNVLSLQGTTNVALNGVSLMDGPSDGNTPQGPWTNWIAGNTWGVSNAGTYKLADTNTILVMLGTNRLSLQGGASTPTNLDWNGSSLINVSGGGGSQTPVTTNIAFAGYTFSNASQGELVQIPTTNHQQAAGSVSFFDDRNRQNRGAAVVGSTPVIPNVSLIVDASNNVGWVGATVRESNDVPVMTLSGVSGPSSSYNPGFALSTASRAMVYNGGSGTARGSPSKTAGDEDVMMSIFRGVDEADFIVWGIPGTAADTTSATMQRMFTARYVEGGTGQNNFNSGKQDFDFSISGQSTGLVFRVDASSDKVGIGQPGLWYVSTAITDATLTVWGNVAIKGDDQPANTHFLRLPGGGTIYEDGTNLWYRNSTGAVVSITAF